PVIVLTATIAPEVRFKALSSGAMDFLAKPVDPSELALRLRNTLVAAAYRDYLAQHDPLTGLPGKTRYRQDVEAAIAAAQTDGSTGALLHIGLDGLKTVNEGLGRSTGDHVLQRFAKQLASLVATEAGGDLSSGGRDPTLYRFDGDEFAVIVPRMDEEDSAGAFIGRLIDDASFALRRSGRELFITGSMGAVLLPADGREADELMTKASLTMRKAKEGGGGRYAFYSPDRPAESARRRLGLGADLRKAVARDELTLLFRKRCVVANQNPVATQAELRWRPSAGIDMAADEVLDLAAQTDAARLLLSWTLERVAEVIGRWRKAGVQVRPVCLPMSLARTPMDDLLHGVKDFVRAGGDPKFLILDLQDLPQGDWDAAGVTSALQALKVDGYRLSLGRLGSARTAVTALQSGLFDEVQIDSALVRSLRSQGPATAFCRGLVQLSHSVGALCVAPGTEVMANWITAKDIGVDQYSGPLTGPALPPVEYAVSGLLPRSKA
ncbi:MAG: diguanylate cyclase, partial [Comamonadaceae bacterium]